jgi:hypothetical protein
MTAEIRVDRITSRTGINTLSFSDNGFSFISNTGIGTTNPTSKLTVLGNVDVTGSVGIGTTNPTSKLTVLGNVNITGVVTATSFSGNAIVNSGITTVAAGTAAAPSISPTGDSNTGIFFPSADTIAFSEGGVERARIDSSGVLGVGDNNPASNALRASFRGPVNGTESALPVVSIVRTNNIGGGTGVAETGLDVQIPNTFNGAGVVKGINVFARHNLGGTAYGIFAESEGGGNAPIIRYAGYFKVTQTDTNGSAVNHAVYAQANSTVTISNNGFAVGVTAETNDYVKNQNFRAVSLYTGASTQTVLSIARNGSAIGSITTLATATSYMTSASSGLLGVDATTIAFQTNSSERARIDSSGRLLIGTTTSSASAAAVLQGFAGSPTGQGILQLQVGKNTAATAINENLGSLRFANSDGNIGALVSGEADLQWNSGDYPSRLVFSTTADGASSPTERMRITNGGASWATTTGSYRYQSATCHEFTVNNNGEYALFISNTNSTSPLGVVVKYDTDINNTANTPFKFQGGTTDRFVVRSNGGLANYQANDVNLSDRNAKKDISLAADTWNCIKEWEIVNYRYKDQPDDADLNLGVIAQQVAESCPEVITVFEEAKEATEDQPAQEERLGVKEQQMYWMAIKALQEAQVRIEALEAEVAALKAA